MTHVMFNMYRRPVSAWLPATVTQMLRGGSLMRTGLQGSSRPHGHPVPPQWLAARSFPVGSFADLDALAARKHRLGLTVTLILPTLNVADTLPHVLTEVLTVARAPRPLIDQVIVVDGSADKSAEIASRMGAEVYREDLLMAGFGPVLGKGDAMWRALTRAEGDIVAFADTDTRNFQSAFVTATIGPLIINPDIRMSKAAFRRPFTGEGDDITSDGGGRVTELTAKPLFNIFYPELTGFAQPLAGEFAARRDLLLSLPFFTGYGVETGLLIDTLRSAGLNAMAQVDVGERLNRHQSLARLGRMSYAVLRTVLLRAGADAAWDSAQAGAAVYAHAFMTGGGFQLAEYPEELVERPPVGVLQSAGV
jgi:glucosyl-3-phosphoglycerate synthase